jgi:hypothetical protein
MRIGFIGTGGTGKSTLIHTLSDVLDEYKIRVLPSVMRDVLRRQKITIDADFTKLDTNMVQFIQHQGFQLREKTEEDYRMVSWISDRTLLDHFVYCLMYCGPLDTRLTQYWETVKQSLQTYDLLVYFPKNSIHKIENRHADPLYHECYEALAVHYLILANVDYTTLYVSDLQQRVNFMSALITKIHNSKTA